MLRCIFPEPLNSIQSAGCSYPCYLISLTLHGNQIGSLKLKKKVGSLKLKSSGSRSFSLKNKWSEERIGMSLYRLKFCGFFTLALFLIIYSHNIHIYLLLIASMEEIGVFWICKKAKAYFVIICHWLISLTKSYFCASCKSSIHLIFF